MGRSSFATTASPQRGAPRLPTSIVMRRLIRDAPADRVTLVWLTNHLHGRSFGVILLLIGVCSMLPVVSPAAGLLLAIPAFQMIRAHRTPVFPSRVGESSIPTKRLAAVLARVIPVLSFLERFVRPRWRMPFKATKRVIGGFVLLLGLCLLTPFPLSNIPIGLAIVLMAFAYLEEDGILLVLSLGVALGLFAAAATLLWSTVSAMIWVIR